MSDLDGMKVTLTVEELMGLGNTGCCIGLNPCRVKPKPMTTLERITADIKDAMRNKAVIKLSTLRGLKNALDLLAKEKKAELSDTEIVGVIRKEIKKRDEALSFFKDADPRVEKDAEEKAVLEAYLPAQLTELALLAIINTVIVETVGIIPAPKKDMGKIIKAVKEKVGGQAEGAVISKLVQGLVA